MIPLSRRGGRGTPGVGRLAAAALVDGFLPYGTGAAVLHVAGVRYDDGLEPVAEAERAPTEWREVRRQLREQRSQGRPGGYVRRDGSRLGHQAALKALQNSAAVFALVVCEVVTEGATPGRRLTRIILVGQGRRAPTRAQLIVRVSAPIVPSALFAALGRTPLLDRRAGTALGLTLAAARLAVQVRDSQHRSLGDRLAGTRLVRAR